jgi:predicted RNA-binding protein (virulence factor B family)
MIMQKLSQTSDGTLSVGDKSSPRDTGLAFPGVSKAAFKKAVAALCEQGKVEPGPDSIKLMNDKDILGKNMKSKV